MLDFHQVVVWGDRMYQRVCVVFGISPDTPFVISLSGVPYDGRAGKNGSPGLGTASVVE